MHCGYLSLHHNWNTKSLRYCWILSLMITETSTTVSRPRSTRKFFLLPLFLSPRLPGEEAGPLAPCIGLSRSELFVSPHPSVKLPHARLMLGLLSLPPPLLLLLLLLQLEVLGQEEGDGAVNAIGATQRRHHQERSFPRGGPHGAVTPLRPGNLRQRCRPLPRRWSLLSPWGVVRLVLHLLLGPGGKLLAPWGAVLLHLHLLLRTSTVVESSCQGHADGLLFVPEHRTQPPLSSSLSSAHGLPA